MLTKEMMMNLETLVTRDPLERKDHGDNLGMMPSAIMKNMANQVIMESQEKTERREDLVLPA